jgi:hypothetical protein
MGVGASRGNGSRSVHGKDYRRDAWDGPFPISDTRLGRRGAKRKPETWRMDLFSNTAAAGGRSLQAALLATNSLRFKIYGESIMTDLIKALRERREELRNELQEHPLFQEYELVWRLLERREASAAVPMSVRTKASQRKPAPKRQPAPRQSAVAGPAPFTRTERGMNAVIEASADFLRRKGARADSAEIQEELVRCGILEEGPRDRSRITSYLGRAKAMFDNVRGEGYGLREWRTPT